MSVETPTVPLESLDPELREKLERAIGDEVEGVVLTRDGQPYLRVTSQPVEVDPYAGKSFKWLLLNGPRLDDLQLPERRAEPPRDLNL